MLPTNNSFKILHLEQWKRETIRAMEKYKEIYSEIFETVLKNRYFFLIIIVVFLF